MHFDRAKPILLALILLSGVPADASAQTCGSGSGACPKGDFGAGGCFSPTSQFCRFGLICDIRMLACGPGDQGPGGCFDGNAATCTAGRICSGTQLACAPGPQGEGGCYDATVTTCDRGRIK